MNYIQRMRNLREDSDKTQQQIADYLGTSQTMYEMCIRDRASAFPSLHLHPDSILHLNKYRTSLQMIPNTLHQDVYKRQPLPSISNTAY